MLGAQSSTRSLGARLSCCSTVFSCHTSGSRVHMVRGRATKTAALASSPTGTLNTGVSTMYDLKWSKFGLMAYATPSANSAAGSGPARLCAGAPGSGSVPGVTSGGPRLARTRTPGTCVRTVCTWYSFPSDVARRCTSTPQSQSQLSAPVGPCSASYSLQCGTSALSPAKSTGWNSATSGRARPGRSAGTDGATASAVLSPAVTTHACCTRESSAAIGESVHASCVVAAGSLGSEMVVCAGTPAPPAAASSGDAQQSVFVMNTPRASVS